MPQDPPRGFVGVGGAIAAEIFVGQRPHDSRRQDTLEEDVALHDQLPAGIAAPRPQGLAEVVGDVVPRGDGHEHGAEQRRGADVGLVAPRVVEAELGAPVVHDEDEIAQAEGGDEAFDVAGVVEESVLDVGLF